jgi:hypothetical protein
VAFVIKVRMSLGASMAAVALVFTARMSVDTSMVAVALVKARISLDSAVLARTSFVTARTLTAQILLHDDSMTAVPYD